MNPLEAWARPPDSGLRTAWLGHSTVLIEIDEDDLQYTDNSGKFAFVQLITPSGLTLGTTITRSQTATLTLIKIDEAD